MNLKLEKMFEIKEIESLVSAKSPSNIVYALERKTTICQGIHL